ncbi:MAG TPA: hypothetical protein VH253_15295 [Phycisphaerae bacterium]|nr:hypothetical protein [Phycisphaerae bacterium]
MTDPPAPTSPPAPPPGPAADPGETHTKLGVYLMANYLLLLVVFVWLLLAAPGELAADTLPLPKDRELFLFGSNLAMLYGVALLLMPVIFALGFLNPQRSRRA